MVSESDIALVHAAERASGRELLKCSEISDDKAVPMLSSATKAARLTKLKLADIGFGELLATFKERKARDRRDRELRDKKALRDQF